MTITLREMTESDYAACVEIHNRIYPDDQAAVEEWVHDASIWDHQTYWRLRLVAVDPADQIIGFGKVGHLQWEFHPRKFSISVQIDPNHWGKGLGSRLYDHFAREAEGREAIALRISVLESIKPAVRFVEKRGFVEKLREWNSQFEVAAFDFAKFAAAEPRIAANGIAIVDLASEQLRDPAALRAAYECFTECDSDVPSVDQITPQNLERFVSEELESPNSLIDGFFLAKRDGEYLGVSNLYKSVAEPGVLYQGLTGVRRDHRGQGIALALKLATIRYARQHGYHQIRTGNAAMNDRMLAINDALGFVRQPAWLEYEKAL